MRSEVGPPRHGPVLPRPDGLMVAVNALPHGVSVLDASGRLTFCNNHFSRVFAHQGGDAGALLSEVLGRSTAMGGEEDGNLALLDHARMVASRQPITLRHRLADGRTLNITHTPLDTGGSVQLYEDVTERLAEGARVRHRSEHDDLTGLANRALFRESFAEAVRASDSTRERGALLTLDLDGFKEINDTLGHAVGDRLLQGVAIRVKRCLRKTDIFARLAGDEFGIAVTQIESRDDALHLASRINAAMEHPFRLDGHQIYAGVSIGIALFGIGELQDQPAELLRFADIAMYSAKAEGKNGCRVFEERMDTQLRERRAFERDLIAAMELDQFSVHYQPQFDLSGGEICGIEALLRWHHPERGHVPPGVFIEVAEKIGLIVPLGEWVLRTACLQAKAWPDLDVAVNVSPIQLRHPSFSKMLDQVLEETGLPPHRLEIEITEGVLLNNTDKVTLTLRQLVARGIKIALDDFGTGYSNLAYLQQFPWSKLKIDRSFVMGLDADAGSAAIVNSVLALGKGLGVRVIAEGIETKRQLELLRHGQCNEGQGYLLGKPMTAAAFEAFRESWPKRRRELF